MSNNNDKTATQRRAGECTAKRRFVDIKSIHSTDWWIHTEVHGCVYALTTVMSCIERGQGRVEEPQRKVGKVKVYLETRKDRSTVVVFQSRPTCFGLGWQRRDYF